MKKSADKYLFRLELLLVCFDLSNIYFQECCRKLFLGEGKQNSMDRTNSALLIIKGVYTNISNWICRLQQNICMFFNGYKLKIIKNIEKIVCFFPLGVSVADPDNFTPAMIRVQIPGPVFKIISKIYFHPSHSKNKILIFFIIYIPFKVNTRF